MKQRIRLKGQLRLYMQWPAIMTILLLGMNIWIYMINLHAGLLMTIFVIMYAIIVGVLYFYNQSVIMADLVEFATQYGVIQNTLLKKLSVPYALLMEDGKILWMNDCFHAIVAENEKQETYVNKYIPELNRGIYPKEDGVETQVSITYQNQDYEVTLRRVSIEGFSETEQLLELPNDQECFIAVYMRDVTDINEYIRENENQRLIAGLIYIDNYDEVMESVEEVRHYLIVALLDRKINQYVFNVYGIVKKM
ncbi:MAG: hypothetical protein RR705_06660 [Lachnospiraceae bacterium]